MTRDLRDYQRDAVANVYAGWGAGANRQAVILPMGCGKTDVIARVATDTVRAGGRCLIFAHRRELLDQIGERCAMHLPGVPVGVVQGETRQTRRPITVGMAQTLQREKTRALIERLTPGRDRVIVDECHHAASPSHLGILRWAGSWDGVETLGVTATMYREGKSGTSLGDVWPAVALERDIAWAIKEEWLVRPRGLRVIADHLDLGKVKTSGGDYAEGEIGDMVAQDADQIADAWVTHGEGRITVAFTPNVVSATELHAAFLRRGVVAELVTGRTSLADRGSASKGTGIYGRLAAGTTRVLVSVMVTTEGWDCPPVSCVLWARPTKITGLYQQGVGRGLRLWLGKPDCLVLDVVGATASLHLRTLTDLAPGVELDVEAVAPRPCEMCGGFRVRPKGDPDARRCVCPVESRDPDGGRRRLIGPQVYEEVDLLASSPFLWLATLGGRPFVPAKDRIGVLWQHGDGWLPGHVELDRYGKGVRLSPAPVDLDTARALCERWAEGHAGATYCRRDAAWRKRGGEGSEGQQRFARRLGVKNPEKYTRAALGDLISIRQASARLDTR